MFIGHYAIGFLVKKKVREMPLWLLFIAVQFVDIVAFVLILFGIERISYNPSDNPFLRTSADFVPFTHSLLGSAVISLVVFLIFWRLKGKTWGVVLCAVVLSHWFIDFISHTPDLPIGWDGLKVGLGLWKFPWAAFLIELSFFIGAGFYLYRGTQKLKRPIILIALAVALYAPMMFAPEGEAPVAVVSIVSLSLYAIFTALAYWSERGKYTAPREE